MNASKTGVTCDDISSAMVRFLAEAERLSELPGGIPFAFNLVMDLARFSHGCMGEGDLDSSGYGERPSDEEIDRLIIDLATRRRQMEPSWNHFKALKQLRNQSRKVADYGVDGFCAKSIELLSGWEKPTVQAAKVVKNTPAYLMQTRY